MFRAGKQFCACTLRTVKLAANVDLKVVALRTTGFAGADLANLVNEATLLRPGGAAARSRSPTSRKPSIGCWPG